MLNPVPICERNHVSQDSNVGDFSAAFKTKYAIGSLLAARASSVSTAIGGSRNRSPVQNFYRDLNEIRGLQFDRIISIAAFEHLCDLPSVVAKSALLLAAGGELRVAVPSEGTVLWKLGWTFTTGIEFRLRHGLDYGVLMRHEHVNTADEIAGILKIFFRKTRRSVLGICAPLSFYQFFQCADPDTGRCGRYLLMR